MQVTKEYNKNPNPFVPFKLIITVQTVEELNRLVRATGNSGGIPFQIYDALLTEQAKLQS